MYLMSPLHNLNKMKPMSICFESRRHITNGHLATYKCPTDI